MAEAAASLGPYVRLEGISVRQLPPDGKGLEPSNLPPLPDRDADGKMKVVTPDLKTFITNVIAEGISFIDGVAPKDGSASKWKVKGSPKKYAASQAAVYLYEKTVSGRVLDKIEGLSKSYERRDETWFCRRSCHQDNAEKGTASWDEFKRSFKEHHAETEDAFTPTIIGAREAIKWDTSGIELETQGQRWTNITVAVEEMKHKIDPKPLKNRTFPVAQVTAELAGVQEFIVVSIPIIDFQNSPYAEFARDKTLVVARYTAIERIRVLPGTGEVEWIMATVSDAGGVLPHWMQNLAVPSAIAKDVELFLAWIPSQRKEISSNAVDQPPSSELVKEESSADAGN
ncbi:hypothetical protein OIDMADRAFT_192146 [Oidiodendron maius Zn]|uniref:DUF3074 domain-containing protein n=1 Tax=Oidiodendron maius (strain Zn) TaxID=913774 RepID=A0A0C3HP44_OIDMZ|nr:hypothetical protein OIDMADRAFT_192146 [Oidiodendron maius Zn]